MAGPKNPTRWRAVNIPEELYRDLEDMVLQTPMSGVGELTVLLIMVGIEALTGAKNAEPAEQLQPVAASDEGRDQSPPTAAAG